MADIIVQLVVKRRREPAIDPPTSHGRDKYLYDCVLDGEALVTSSHDPEHELARALLARGITGWVQMVEAGTEPAKKRLRFNIERFAATSQIDYWKRGLQVIPYKPFPGSTVVCHSASEPSEAPEGH